MGGTMTPLSVGVIGCGNISGIYFRNMPTFNALEVVACSDLNPELSSAVVGACNRRRETVPVRRPM